MVRRTAAGALLAFLVCAGCNDNIVPIGTSGSVIVRAFVDADGSGAYSTGDVVLAGSVTLTPVAGGAALNATLDSQGEASFTGVHPGTYAAAFSGTPPNGAVLATGTTADIVVPFKGGSIESDFRFVYNPGQISGVLFKDNNANGVFDAGVDTPAPGMAVALFAGSTTTGTPVATTSTGNAGDFTFKTLRPGTYVVQITPIPTIQIVGGTTQTVTVGAAATQTVPVMFTGNLLTMIDAARAAAVGSTVAFIGVATANAGLLGSNQLYVQDATAGILVFGAPTAGIVAGDTVRVIGVTSLFNGELEVAAPAGGAVTVTKLGTGPVPQPKAISIAQLLSNAFAGQLVSVQGATVRSTASTGATSYNVNMQGATPADTFQIRLGNSTLVPIPIAFWTVGQAYTVTGVAGVFKGEPQLKPRAMTDVSFSMTIAQARTHAATDTVTVEGVVYAGTGVYTQPTAANLSAYIQDGTGGTEIFNIPTGTVLVAGDSIRVTGVVSFFNSEYEIARFNSTTPPVIVKLGTSTTPTPKTITSPQLASKAFDGQFVRLSGLTVTAVGTPNGSGAYNVSVTAPDASTFTVRIDNAAVGIVNTSWTVGSRYDVAGAALNFSSTGNAPFTPELKPRSPADVSPTPTGLITIAAAKAVLNDTVTVEGIVTASRTTFRNDNAYIQDATSGVQIFNLPPTLSLQVGDAVRVHGKMTVFSGENEITNTVTPTDSIKVTKLGSGAAPAPRVVTGAQFLARTFEGQLVTLQSVTILTIGNPSGSGTYTVTGTALDASTVTIFMSAPTGNVPTPASTYAVGQMYDITGIAVPFGTPSAAELKPRGAADVVHK